MPAPPRSRSVTKRREPKLLTRQWRNWRGLNLTDARTAIDDDEFAWLENALTVGKGAAQILNGPGTAIATIAVGTFSAWGFVLNGNPVIITINTDGSISQIAVPGGAVTAVAPAGTVSTSARCAIWRGSPILIIDPTFGYFSWDGATLTTIDASRTRSGIAVFEGRVWLFTSRTIEYTAPTTFNNFTAGDGAGSTILTDESFPGNIVELHSAVEQLWIIGQGAIDTLSNVVATGVSPSVVTTFSITNIVTNLGSNAHASVIGYFRALALMAPFGAYALAGVTPQKLSDKLDGGFPDFTLGNCPAAVGTVQSLQCLFFLVTYDGNNAAAASPGPTPLVLGFVKGNWFLGAQGTALRWITTVLVSGVPQVWGINATQVFRLFGADDSTAVTYKIQGKLSDHGSVVSRKVCYKVGVEVQASSAIAPTVTVDSELGSVNVDIDFENLLTLINNSNATLQLLNNLGNPLNLVGTGIVLTRYDAPLAGFYLGWTLQGTDAPYRLGSVALQYAMDPEWTA